MNDKVEIEYQIYTYAQDQVRNSGPVGLDEALTTRFGDPEPEPAADPLESRFSGTWSKNAVVMVSTAAAVIVILGLIPLLASQGSPPALDLVGPSTTLSVERFDPVLAPPEFPVSGNPTTTEFGSSVAGDDGSSALPLGTVTGLGFEHYLDFFSQDCPDCFLDARFKGPGLSDYGSGPWVAGRPFVVRHGFLSSGSEPLGAGFDVEVFLTRWDGPDLGAGVFVLGTTYRFTSDYVLRGTVDRCGPTHSGQAGPVECEWFVHEFPEGIPEGRYDLWAVWKAPCSAWVEMGLTDSCGDPGEVISLFSSSVNSPFGYDENILDG